MTVIKPLAAIALGTSMLMSTASAIAVEWSEELGDHAGKTLRIIMIQDPWVDQFATINPEFEELTGAKVEIESFGYDQTHEKQVLEGASGRSQYDIIVLDSPWIGEFAEAGFVEDLQPYIDDTDPEVIAWDDFMPAFQQVADWNGTIRRDPVRGLRADAALPHRSVRRPGSSRRRPSPNGRRSPSSSPTTPIFLASTAPP